MAQSGYWTEGKIVNGTNVGGGTFVPTATNNVSSAVNYVNSAPAGTNAGDFAGTGKYASGLQNIITSNSLANTSPIPVPNAPIPTNYNGTLIGGNVGVGLTNGTQTNQTNQPNQSNTTTQTTQQVQPTQTNQPKSFVDTIKEITGLYKAPVDTSSIYQQLQNETQIQAKQQAVNNLSAQLNAITAKSQADQLSVTGQGRGIPEAIIGGQQAQISKEAAIQALPIQAQLAYAQGNLQMAQENLNTLFKIRSEDAIAQTNQYNKLVDMSYDIFSKAEQRQIDSIKADRATNLSILNNATNNAQSIASNLFKSGNVSLASQITGLKQPDPASPTFQSDLQDYNASIARLTGQQTSSVGTTSSYIQGSNPVVDSWAERIQNGSAKITDIPASQASLRNQVTVALQAMGNNTEGKPTTTELGKSALTTAQSLYDKFNSGKGTSAVGKSGLLNSLGYGLIPGTDRANFVTDFNALKSQLSLEGVKYLKGQGQVSDSERALLARAVTKLDLSQSEDEFKTTLESIIKKLNGGVTNATTEGTLSSGVTYKVISQ